MPARGIVPELARLVPAIRGGDVERHHRDPCHSSLRRRGQQKLVAVFAVLEQDMRAVGSTTGRQVHQPVVDDKRLGAAAVPARAENDDKGRFVRVPENVGLMGGVFRVGEEAQSPTPGWAVGLTIRCLGVSRERSMVIRVASQKFPGQLGRLQEGNVVMSGSGSPAIVRQTYSRGGSSTAPSGATKANRRYRPPDSDLLSPRGFEMLNAAAAAAICAPTQRGDFKNSR